MKTTVFSTTSVVFLCLLYSFHSMTATAYTPEASGTVTYGNNKTMADTSYASGSYLMIKYTGSNPTTRLRTAKDITYTHILSPSGQYETFPLTEGSGTYSVKILELVSGTQYMQVASESVLVMLSSDTKLFLYSNQFRNFNVNLAIVSQAGAITSDVSGLLDEVAAIHNYTVDIITCNSEKAKTARSDYLPNPDTTLSQKSGICFDYALLMTSMLCPQNIPTKLVTGYAGDVYHAWMSIYIWSQGWTNNVIYLGGASWKFMDPVFISSGKESQEALDYASNPARYTAKLIY